MSWASKGFDGLDVVKRSMPQTAEPAQKTAKKINANNVELQAA